MVLFRLMMPCRGGLLLLRDEVISQFMNSSHLFLGESVILRVLFARAIVGCYFSVIIAMNNRKSDRRKCRII